MVSKKDFEILFRELYPELLRYAAAFTGNIIVAEDIVQEVFISFWESRKVTSVKVSARNYLFKAIKYRAINYLQREVPDKRKNIDLLHTPLITHTPYFDDQLHAIIRSAVYSLPNQCRAIFLLSRFTGLTYREIAEHLNISVKTVETQMSIALRKIKEFLIAKGALCIWVIFFF
jgi:RNA polymerase sigma-70 factor, ECF subfamily